MALAIRIQIEQLPEGLFLATSDELSGLVAQGRTVADALDIALAGFRYREIVRKLRLHGSAKLPGLSKLEPP